MSCKNLTFEEKELAILRDAVDTAEEITKRESAMSPEITEMMIAVEDFLRKTKCICYGGTAINNILPVDDQFYDKQLEIPDYDFYSRDALKHAKGLADIYAKLGWKDVEAKAACLKQAQQLMHPDAAHSDIDKPVENILDIYDVADSPIFQTCVHIRRELPEYLSL